MFGNENSITIIENKSNQGPSEGKREGGTVRAGKPNLIPVRPVTQFL